MLSALAVGVVLVSNPKGLLLPAPLLAVADVVSDDPVVFTPVEPEEEELVPVVSTLLLLLFLMVPPTAPPTTAPMTMRTATTTVMMPARLRQKDVRGFGAVGEPNFSPEPASAMVGNKGTVAGAGWGVCGGGLRTEGVRRGGCSRRSTLYPSYMEPREPRASVRVGARLCSLPTCNCARVALGASSSRFWS